MQIIKTYKLMQKKEQTKAKYRLIIKTYFILGS